ncbi:MAG TPA: cysteine desulfurase family protein, partial [Nevskiales bacterium]|nr:cysteine desulfurase family protein [Nevskiales bacterium]
MPVYFDHNATAPLDPRVLEAMLPYLADAAYGNPSSVHRYGRAARQALDTARAQVAALVGAEASQLTFTSGGTEANNLALKGYAARHPGRRMLVSAIEHACIVEPAQALARQGVSVEWIPVDARGQVDLAALETLLARGNVGLVAVMYANNETGVVQDIPALAARVRAAGGVLHCDAVQAAGKLPLDFRACGAHSLTLSAHKIYGPRGVGALLLDKTLELEPLLHGGGQEKGLRGGTENLAAIVGFGKAAELAATELAQRAAHTRALRERLEAGLRALPGVVIFGDGAERLPNTVQFGTPGFESETLLMALDRKGIAVSSGSACHSGKTEPSHVLLAMGVEPGL